MTGLLNRIAFRKRVKDEYERARRYGINISLLVLDVDYFKSINDAFGHSRGDELLIQFAALLKKQIRSSDKVFRFGGDEFVILLPETSKQKAIAVAERLLHSVTKYTFGQNPPLRMSISVGISNFPEDATNPSSLFDLADYRLLQAKNKGRNRAIFDDLHDQKQDFCSIETRLIERDAALDQWHQILNNLASEGKCLVCLTGNDGSGFTRLISEFLNLADLRDLETYFVKCNPLLRGSPFGIISEYFKTNNPGRLKSLDMDKIHRSLSKIFTKTKKKQIVIGLDDTHEIDRESAKGLAELFIQKNFSQDIILLYTHIHPNPEAFLELTSESRKIINLQPLTADGLKIWMRTQLQSEPNNKFINWLHRETSGYPAHVHRALKYFLTAGLLTRKDSGWSVTGNFKKLRLAEFFDLQMHQPPTRLPTLLTAFVGRLPELQAVIAAMDEHRLITLVGPGGIGKSRLSIQVGQERLRYFEDGVFFIPLAPVTSKEFIIPAIAESIDFSFHSAKDARIQLLDFLRTKEMLLIFDNFEHLTEAADLICEILEKCPDIRIIITSKEKLNVLGEIVFPIKGLNFPLTEAETNPEDFSAVKLFVQSAQRAEPRFALTQENSPYILKICRLIEGMPLAIELSAPWVRVLSCAEIADEIEKNLDFLESTQINLPDRHRSIRAAFEHSWTLLNENEQLAFSALSVFRGGFTREAAREVSHATLDAITNLMNKSLIYRSASGRYYILEVLRQYAAGKLHTDVKTEFTIKKQHCEFFSTFLNKAKSSIQQQQMSPYLDLIKIDIDNLREGWFFALDHFLFDMLEHYIDGLSLYYDRSCFYQEALELFPHAIDILQNCTSNAAKDSDKFNEILGKICSRAGTFYFILSDYPRAVNCLMQSKTIFENLDNPKELALALNGLGGVYSRIGEYQKSREFHEKSLDIRYKINDKRGIASSLNNLANVIGSLGDNVQASHLYEKSLEIVREIGDSKALSALLANLGLACGVLGDREKERKLLLESYQIRKESKDLLGMALSLDNLGNSEHFLGDYEAAYQMHSESLQIRRKLGDRWGVALSLLNIANVFKATGKFNEAVKSLDQCIPIYREIGDRAGLALALNNYGELLCEQDDFQTAVRYFNESSALFDASGDSWGIIVCKINNAACALNRKDHSVSLKTYKEALQLAMDMHFSPLIYEIMIGFAELVVELPSPELHLARTISTFVERQEASSRELKAKIESLCSRYFSSDSHSVSAQTVPPINLKHIAETIIAFEIK